MKIEILLTKKKPPGELNRATGKRRPTPAEQRPGGKGGSDASEGEKGALGGEDLPNGERLPYATLRIPPLKKGRSLLPFRRALRSNKRRKKKRVKRGGRRMGERPETNWR